MAIKRGVDPNILSPEQLAYRDHVVNKEMEAREAEAIYNKYYFVIESDKLREQFNEVMQRNLELARKQQEDIQKIQEDAKANAELLKRAVAE